MFDPVTLARENIRSLSPYSSARHEFAGSGEVFLDANENPFGSPTNVALNRYPDPLQREVKEKLGKLNGAGSDSIFVGNGSDEAIDLLIRIFCEPGKDRAMTFPPTYGMYRVSADVNAVEVDEVRLTEKFHLDQHAIDERVSPATKVIFICSPNNPTGNSMQRDDVLSIAGRLDAIVVVDEAYIDFSDQSSLVTEIDRYPNLVVLQTFSKAWGLAGARVGVAFANPKIIELLDRVKPPYNVNSLSQTAVLAAFERIPVIDGWVEQIKSERSKLASALADFSFVTNVFPSDANFLLVKVDDADSVYRFLLTESIVIRNRSNLEGCKECLRITVGTPDENRRLIAALSKCSANMPAVRPAIQSI